MSQRFIRNRTDYSLLFMAFFLWMQLHISAHICLLQSWEQSPSESVTGDSCRVTVQAGADHAAPAASLTIEIAVWMPFSNPQMVRDGEKLGGGWGWWYHSSQDNPVKVVVSLRRSIIRCCADQPWLNAATGVMIRQDTTQDVDSLDAIVTLVLEFASKPLSSCGFLYL